MWSTIGKGMTFYIWQYLREWIVVCKSPLFLAPPVGKHRFSLKASIELSHFIFPVNYNLEGNIINILLGAVTTSQTPAGTSCRTFLQVTYDSFADLPGVLQVWAETFRQWGPPVSSLPDVCCGTTLGQHSHYQHMQLIVWAGRRLSIIIKSVAPGK